MIRKYKSTDADDVIEIWANAAKETYTSISDIMIESICEDLRNIYLPFSEIWVAQHNNKIVGFIALHKKIVGGLVVHPEYQGTGIGKSLVEYAKSRKGSISLDILRENTRAVKFYEKCGFTPTKHSICPVTGAETVTVIA